MASKPGSLPLEGITVIELSTVVTAALGVTLLCEQGARGIKVEPPGIGDPLRYLGTASAGVSALFANCNRGKESIALDLKQAEGVAVVRELAARADVLISNYRPGVLDRLGLGYDTLRAANPGLVYLSISGFGTEGPLASAPAYDHVIQAMSGFAAVQGRDGKLDLVRTFVCDEVTAYTACQAATAALFQRERTGEGQRIDLSMLDAALYFLWPAGMSEHTFTGDGVVERSELKNTYRAFPTRDGFFAMAPFTDHHWHGLFRATGNGDLCEDPRYATIGARATALDELFDRFEAAFAAMATAEVEALLRELDIPGGRCLALEETIAHPQLAATGSVQAQTHPVLGPLRSPAHPARFGGQRLPPRSPLGALGEHTDAVLGELGYDAAAIAALREKGVAAG